MGIKNPHEIKDGIGAIERSDIAVLQILDKLITDIQAGSPQITSNTPNRGDSIAGVLPPKNQQIDTPAPLVLTGNGDYQQAFVGFKWRPCDD